MSFKNEYIWYFWKATAEWNITVENIFEERMLKSNNLKMKIFNIISKITTVCKISSQNFESFLIRKIFSF